MQKLKILLPLCLVFLLSCKRDPITVGSIRIAFEGKPPADIGQAIFHFAHSRSDLDSQLYKIDRVSTPPYQVINIMDVEPRDWYYTQEIRFKDSPVITNHVLKVEAARTATIRVTFK
jgi:hypothetical protein